MAVRPSLAYLIRRVRSNISDIAGSDEVFADEEIQEYLDNRRRDIFEMPLLTSPDRKNFYSEVGGWWEDNVELTTSGSEIITDSTTPAVIESNLITGQWKLDGPLSSLRLSGVQYDINGCSADLLDSWLARIKLEFDFLELGSTFKASQQALAVEQAVKRYRARQWVFTSHFRSTDYAAGWYQ